MSISIDIEKTFKTSAGTFRLAPKFSTDVGMTVFLGPSASGKTATLKCVAGLLQPDSGTIELNGDTFYDSASRVNLAPRKRRVGYVFQDLALFPHLTVADNIVFGIRGSTRWAKRSMIEDMLKLMRLDQLYNCYPHQLSGGQRQRVALARALVIEPQVLLLDEPFTALDNAVREKLRSDIARIQASYDVPMILVTHDMEEAFEMAQQLVIFDRGRVLQVGDRDEVFYRPRNKTVARFVGSKNIYSGKLVGLDGGQARVATENFEVVCSASNGFSVGQEVEFCIRPEEVMIVRPDRQLSPGLVENVFSGNIVEAVHSGPTFSTKVRLPNSSNPDYDFAIKLPSHAYNRLRLSVGSPISISLKKSALHLLEQGDDDD